MQTLLRSHTPRLQVNLVLPSTSEAHARIEGVKSADWFYSYLEGLPLLHGGPIRLEFQPSLNARRGKLISGLSERGKPVHAASFLRGGRIVLENSLLASPDDLRLILTHEIFHFVWWKLGNARRAEFDALLRREREGAARGELGESALVAKTALTRSSQAKWKDYVCESFCDTAAWLYSGVNEHVVFQLAARWRRKRAEWFRGLPPFAV